MTRLLLLELALIAVLILVAPMVLPGIRRRAVRYLPKALMSEPEQVLYWRLRKALPEHLVCPQVGLDAILKSYGVARNYIVQLRTDFTICDKASNVIAVIELDDNSHNRAIQKDRDAKKDAALASAGIEVIRWNVKHIPNEATIQAALRIERYSPQHARNSETPAISPDFSTAHASSSLKSKRDADHSNPTTRRVSPKL